MPRSHKKPIPNIRKRGVNLIKVNDQCSCKKKKNQSKTLKPLEVKKSNESEEDFIAVGGASNGEFNEFGIASWYGRDFDGKPTASGEIFDSRKLTAAHKKIPLGSIILVRNMGNEREVFLKVNDRGPYIQGRILDVSEYAAEVLGYKQDGLTHVGIRVVRHPDKGKGLDSYKKSNSNSIRKKLSKPTKAKGDLFSVQVGAFNDIRYAQRMERDLSSYKQPIQIRRHSKKYLVQAGSFASYAEAEKLKIVLREDGYSAFVYNPLSL